MIGMQYYLRRQDTVARIFFASAAVLKLPASVAARGENARDEHNRAPLAQQKKFRIGGGSRWFQWILEGIPDDPAYICPALASER